MIHKYVLCHDVGVKQPALSERLRTAIRGKILRGEYEPGRLVIEADLAEEFGVSKTPVREVLQLLAAEGLVTVLSKKGYMVRTMDFEDVREIMDVRMLLEPHAADAAARSVTEPMATQLREILDRQRNLQEQPLEAMAAAQQFHTEVARAGGNQRVFEMLSRMFDETARAHHVLPAMQRYMSSDQEQAEHDAILAAIETGDGLEAAERMRQHLKSINVEMRSAAFGCGGLWD